MVRYEVNGTIDEERLNALFRDAWPSHKKTHFAPILESSLLYVIAYSDDRIVGFVRVEGCSGVRGFVVGPTVHPDLHRKGVGTTLLNEAASAARERGLRSLHVEFPSELRPLYAAAGFRHSAAAVRKLRPRGPS